MKLSAFLLIIFYLTVGNLNSQSWTQKGSNIDGDAIDDYSGWAVCMPDEFTVAISSYRADSAGNSAGLVRVMEWDGTDWVQKGSSLFGQHPYEHAGYSIHMPDANTIAVGADKNDENGTESGQVRVYEWDGGDWVQKGSDLNGEARYDYFGYAVNMPDANTLAVGADRNDDHGTNAGEVNIYKWNGTNWVLKGQGIGGESESDQSGRSVSMPDSNTVAIGAPYNDGGGTASGHARVFTWNGAAWVQKGNDIDGAKAGDFSVNLSMPDPNTIAFGSGFNSDGGYNAGEARVFEWNGSAWVQKGGDLEGMANQEFGWSVDMPDANTLAVGGYRASPNGMETGFVSVFNWDGNNWIKVGNDIQGTTAYEWFGWSISMPNANTIVAGAPNCGDLGRYRGRTRVYTIASMGLNDSNPSSTAVQVFPNPGQGVFSVDLGKTYQNIQFQLSDMNGRFIYEGNAQQANTLEIDLNVNPGLYLLKVQCDSYESRLRLLIE